MSAATVISIVGLVIVAGSAVLVVLTLTIDPFKPSIAGGRGRGDFLAVSACPQPLSLAWLRSHHRGVLLCLEQVDADAERISLRIPTMPPGHTEVEASTCSNLMPSTVLR